MARAPRSRAETRRIALGEDLRIGEARATFESLAAAGSGARSLEIDGAAVARVDAAGLQALAVAFARLEAAGVECRWGEVSPVLSGAAHLGGLAQALALPRAPETVGPVK
jgi:anti-anti-sigma regulatory factor